MPYMRWRWVGKNHILGLEREGLRSSCCWNSPAFDVLGNGPVVTQVAAETVETTEQETTVGSVVALAWIDAIDVYEAQGNPEPRDVFDVAITHVPERCRRARSRSASGQVG